MKLLNKIKNGLKVNKKKKEAPIFPKRYYDYFVSYSCSEGIRNMGIKYDRKVKSIDELRDLQGLCNAVLGRTDVCIINYILLKK